MQAAKMPMGTYFSPAEEMETLSNSTPETKETREETLIYQSGASYSGEWRGAQRWGKGEMKWSDGTSYNGEWRAGKASG